jgi:hypothetical protein
MKTKRLLIGLLLSLSAASTHAATLTSAHEVEGAYPSTLLGTLNLETATQEELEQAFLTETDPESCAIRWKIAPTLIKRYGLTSLENIIKSVEKDFSMVDMDDMNIYRMSSAFGIAFAFKDLFDKNFNISFTPEDRQMNFNELTFSNKRANLGLHLSRFSFDKNSGVFISAKAFSIRLA